jgi:beta-N-acetylhexosaminidase
MRGQLLMLGVAGPILSSAEADFYRRIQPSGFILFSRNIVDARQTRRLTDELRSLLPYEVIIAIDQEGGRVSRTKDIAPACPSAVDLAATRNPLLIAQAGSLTADMLRLLGCNLNFAPVLDIDHFPGLQNALRERCWGDDPQKIINHAGMWNRWMRKRGLLSCAKHFPSCGIATSDPHHDLPVAQVDIATLLKNDILPYTALMPELDAVMTSHVRFPLIDGEHPASLSGKIINGFLRNQLGFDHHLVITDDLDMSAISKAYGRGSDVSQAIRAGNDLALICHQIDSADKALDALQDLPLLIVDDALNRIERFRKKLHAPLDWSEEKWQASCGEIAKLRAEVPPASILQANSPVADY